MSFRLRTTGIQGIKYVSMSFRLRIQGFKGFCFGIKLFLGIIGIQGIKYVPVSLCLRINWIQRINLYTS